MDRYDQDWGAACLLQLVVLRRRGEVLDLVESLPSWWPESVATVRDRHVEFEHPFLQFFLEDAEKTWHADEECVISSGIFEVDELHLQALAAKYRGQDLLIVRNLDTIDESLTRVLRLARTNLLRHHTDRARQTRELDHVKADRDEARRMEQLKSEFLANMSHEIRTPLTTILGMAGMAKEADSSKLRDEYIDGVLAAGHRLLRLGNDILDLSRIQAHRMALDKVPFSIRTAMAESEKEWRLHADERGLTFALLVHDDVPDIVIGDGFRLRQVLSNLVGNSLKFTDEGGITVAIAPNPASEDSLTFSVADTGVGIPLRRQAEIFESFTQVDSTVRRRQQGAGLGLAIAHSLVQLMGGELQVDSAPGVGSTFFFSSVLPPHQELVDSLNADDTETPSSQLCILIAEDHKLNRMIIADTLQSCGHHIHEVDNGKCAVEAWKNGAFDVILMDCQMPIMSGLDAIQAIRQVESGGHERTPILALTAHAMQEEKQKLLDSGADAYLAKPFERSELIGLVAKLAST